MAWIRCRIFLKQDVKNGLHEEMKPMQLHQTREEYQKFSVKVFRKHIYQETQNNNDSNYWLVKKTKKEKKKQAKKEGEKYEDNDKIFTTQSWTCIMDDFFIHTIIIFFAVAYFFI